MRHTLTLLLSIGLAACGGSGGNANNAGGTPIISGALPSLSIESAEAAEGAPAIVLPRPISSEVSMSRGS